MVSLVEVPPSLSAPRTGAAGGQDLLEGDRPEVPHVHPHIELPREPLQPAVRMTMKVDGASSHPVPGPERVVAEHEMHARHLELEVGAHAGKVAKGKGLR